MPKIGANTDSSFLLNDIPKQRGAYDFIVSNRENSNPYLSLIFVNSRGVKEVLTSGNLDKWTKQDDSNFTNLADFFTYVEPFFFRKISGGGGGGAVDSVNGKTGNVVLSADDIGESQGFTNTFFVDVNGKSANTGKDPSFPTTLDNALNNASFGDLLLISEGVYNTGGSINITESNITIKSLQGGTGSNSVIIENDIIIGSGITRFRSFGVRFDGLLHDNGSDGRHYVSWASLGVSGQIKRTNPKNWFEIIDSDIGSGSLIIEGVGSANTSTTVSGNNSKTGNKTLSATNHFFRLFNNAVGGSLTASEGFVVIDGCSVIGASGVVNIGANAVFIAKDSSITDALGVPQSITIAGNYEFRGLLFDKVNSTITGAENITNTYYYSGTIDSN